MRSARKGIFMIDASKGFRKDGPKNRLREQDIHHIVDTFTRQVEIPGYSRLVPVAEISDAKNDYNLNLPRYIDSTEPEDLQDIGAHLRGGIPERDIDALERYWQVIPGVRAALSRAAVAPATASSSVPARRHQAGHLRPRRVHRLQRPPPRSSSQNGRSQHARAQRLRQGRPPQGAHRDDRRGPARHLCKARRCSTPTTSIST